MLPCNSNDLNKKFNFENPTRQMPSEPTLHTFFKLKAKNDGFTSDGWQGQNLCLAHRPIGVHDHSPVVALVHQMCTGVSVRSFQSLSTDSLSLSQFQSKPKLCNGSCNRRNLNDMMRKGLKTIFVTRKLHNNFIKIKIMRRWIACSFFWVAECK